MTKGVSDEKEGGRECPWSFGRGFCGVVERLGVRLKIGWRGESANGREWTRRAET